MRKSIESVFAGLDLRVGQTRRVVLDEGDLLPLAPGRIVLAYLVEGDVRTDAAPLATACAVDIDRAGRTRIRPAAHRALSTGDAFLSLGSTPLLLEIDAPSDLLLVDVEFATQAALFAAILPDFVSVLDFAALEPAAAALAANMSAPTADPSGTCSTRVGDGVICGMMAKTVLLSLLRAWAENGCAPAGWPSVAADPFLERVVDEIHREPGRDWTIDALASLGAMSRSVFAERFRTALGRPPASYVAAVRIDAAKRMLDEGLPIAQIARELGYSSDEGFRRAFRRLTGTTPSLWRTDARTVISA